MAKFIETIAEDLKQKGLCENSIKLYIRNLKAINGDADFTSFKFLKDTDEVVKFLSKFKPSTRKSYIGCIISILGLYPSNKSLTALKNKYYLLFNGENNLLKETAGERSEKQRENWIDWADVEKLWDEKHAEVMAMTAEPKKSKKAVRIKLSDAEYTKLLNFMVLSLYVKIAPRRNEDFTKMFISVDGAGTDDKTKNWLDLKNKNFIFNVFKTSKDYPNQTVSIPDDLMHVIEMYLRHYPKPVADGVPFLVFADGSPLKSVNSITRILNKIFGKSVGCSLLRHSYLTSKYGDVNKEREKDASNMGHSLATQSDYVLH